MDADQKFWLAIWSLITAFVFAIAVVIAVHDVITNRLVARSPDPVATACALAGSVAPQCLLVSHK